MIVHTRPLCLSPRQWAVLVALYRLARPKPYGLGHWPRLTEIMYETPCGSTSTVWLDLDALWKLGLVTRPPVAAQGLGAARAWRPNMDRLVFITQDGETIVREWLDAAT